MKRVILLGATGSIGQNAIEVIRSHPDNFRLVAASAFTSATELAAIGDEFGARTYLGEKGALLAVIENDADVVLVATVGLSGLAPTLASIDRGMDIALATKEVLVMAGAAVTAAAKKRNVRFLPVDSEHSAIFQCLNGARAEEIDRLILTCSGGPFLQEPADLSSVTPAQALNHPRWKMGPKVTIDSATMINKGFEIVEAHWLFGLAEDHIDVVIHPESIVHSLVTFKDGATLAQLSPPDMRVAIQYALSAPRRLAAQRDRLDLAHLSALHFSAPPQSRFPALGLVRKAIAQGGGATAVLAAADEILVKSFLNREIAFTEIVRRIECAVNHFDYPAPTTLEDVLEISAAVGAFLNRIKP